MDWDAGEGCCRRSSLLGRGGVSVCGEGYWWVPGWDDEWGGIEAHMARGGGGREGERGVARAGEVCTTAGDRLEWDVATGSLCGSYVAKSAERQRKVLCVMLFRTV